MKQLLALLILSSLFSCSPEKRLARLIKLHPELVSHDTIYKDTTIFLPSKEITGEAEIDKNYNRIDSIINSYNGKLDSISKLKLINEVKYYVTNKPILLDTIKIDSLGLHLSLFEANGKLHYDIKLDSSNVNFKYAQKVNSVNPVTKVREAEWYDVWIIRPFAILALIFIILDQVAYGIGRKKD